MKTIGRRNLQQSMAEADGFMVSLATRKEHEVWHNFPVDIFLTWKCSLCHNSIIMVVSVFTVLRSLRLISRS